MHNCKGWKRTPRKRLLKAHAIIDICLDFHVLRWRQAGFSFIKLLRHSHFVCVNVKSEVKFHSNICIFVTIFDMLSLKCALAATIADYQRLSPSSMAYPSFFSINRVETMEIRNQEQIMSRVHFSMLLRAKEMFVNVSTFQLACLLWCQPYTDISVADGRIVPK